MTRSAVQFRPQAHNIRKYYGDKEKTICKVFMRQVQEHKLFLAKVKSRGGRKARIKKILQYLPQAYAS
jgi:hypothetical protein